MTKLQFLWELFLLTFTLDCNCFISDSLCCSLPKQNCPNSSRLQCNQPFRAFLPPFLRKYTAGPLLLNGYIQTCIDQVTQRQRCHVKKWNNRESLDPHWHPWKIIFFSAKLSSNRFGSVVKTLCSRLLKRGTEEEMSQAGTWGQRVEAATPAAGRLPAPRRRSRHPPRASWLPSLVAPPEAPVGPHRTHLHARGTEGFHRSWKLKSISTCDSLVSTLEQMSAMPLRASERCTLSWLPFYISYIQSATKGICPTTSQSNISELSWYEPQHHVE